MDPEDSEHTAPAPTEGDSVEEALAPEDTSSESAQAPTESTPDAPAAASAPEAETPPQPVDKRAILDDPETAAWLEERVNARVNRHLQRMQQQQAAAQQQAQLDDLIQRADAGDYEAERVLAQMKSGEYKRERTLTDPTLTTRVLDGMVKSFLANASLPPAVQQAAYTSTTVDGFVDAVVEYRISEKLKDYVPKTEASRREAQAAEKERLRMAKAAPAPDLIASTGIVDAPTGPLAEITAITERTQKRGYLSSADATTLERLSELAV